MELSCWGQERLPLGSRFVRDGGTDVRTAFGGALPEEVLKNRAAKKGAMCSPLLKLDRRYGVSTRTDPMDQRGRGVAPVMNASGGTA